MSTTISDAVSELLAAHDPSTTERFDFLRAQFDAGLAWVHYPEGLGGRGLDRELQVTVDRLLAEAGAPNNEPHRNIIGLGMAAPTILRFGTDEQKARWLRPLWTGEEIWCQLFSEPGAGSDLANVATSAVRKDDRWVVNGQKVWTSLAHDASWAILVTRTDTSVPKHKGLTFFVCDMSAAGVDVRPLRQITGESEFNEVFLDGVEIPDEDRLGNVGQGWAVTQNTLMNERVAIAAGTVPRESGAIGELVKVWRTRPELRTAALHDEVMQFWVGAEVARLTAERLGQKQAAGQPGPEASGSKLTYARLNQQIASLELDLLGAEALRYGDYSARRPVIVEHSESPAGWRYLRAKGNSIEGGTSEIMRNIIAERVLQLPPEPRADKDTPWKDLPR
ncbi:acyl-CoA dehydrogenase family protein [Gordonia terrae]|uniref:Acyl-CoA dehydrogenase n=2 Tax=Gordonia terrae TaxID=2055 RepID=A0AAD0NZ81_9ACTN|nr:acyl-CoA dehydrogenase family protein [Gordonia terrae]VTR10831.1 butyryl-CoA dehydrogenase [Clostridioides difficile]ANY24388.1 acyl-CoA dehydrogenase [Gordonia terrae]AWO85135.1 acyl-CoA dehydrogenase [Gordonia terrae]VTS58744.1 (R)-benzylsuccinyl-CoA dehydrogenase [Gordonia terrae]GAB46766.1 putative acyl-CoA dehydrogenase [Gordonia terrae NBRC 100016]